MRNNNYDFFYEFKVNNENEAIDLTNSGNRFSAITSLYTKLELYSTALADPKLKKFLQVGEHKNNRYRNKKANLKSLIHSSDCCYKDVIKQRLEEMNSLKLIPKVNKEALPENSVFIQIQFTLKSPFISNDDAPFYIIDNPIRKEKVFKIPMMSSTSWKGNLRWVMAKSFLIDETLTLNEEDFAKRRLELALLFGNEKGLEEDKSWTRFLKELKPEADKLFKNKINEWFNLAEQEKQASFIGRLRFYPTFFNDINLLVINPHNRLTKTGTNPIYFECVPANSKGIFYLLYFPYDLISRKLSEEEKQKIIKEDIKKILVGIKKLLLVYGCSAKRSSGFGVTEDFLKEEVIIISANSNYDDYAEQILLGEAKK